MIIPNTICLNYEENGECISTEFLPLNKKNFNLITHSECG